MKKEFVYTCDVCGEKYNTPSEALSCEKAHGKNRLKKKSEKAINDLVNQYIHMFGTFPVIEIDEESCEMASGPLADLLFDALLKQIDNEDDEDEEDELDEYEEDEEIEDEEE